MKKRTLRREAKLSGRGVHTGKAVSLVLKPSASGRVVFRRLDLSGASLELDPLKARAESSSLLVEGSVVIRTVEHLLAVLYVFGLDSLEICLDSEEIPIGDGSAGPFVELIQEAGVEFLPEEKKILKVEKPLRIEKGDAWINFSPASDFALAYTIDYPHPSIGRQEFRTNLRVQDFIKGIAPARTFGFLRDVAAMRERGLARGGSLENAIVLDDQGIINPPLRFPDEFVRHKVLDLIGDLALIGRAILGKVEIYKGGHGLHQLGIASLLKAKDCWVEETEFLPQFLGEAIPERG